MKSIKGPKIPHLFQTLQYALYPLHTLEFCAKKYGDIFTLANSLEGDEPVVYVSNPQAIQEILSKDNHEYEAPADKELKFVLGQGQHSVFMLEGDRHRRERKLLMPPFHKNRMGNYGEGICEITKQIASQLAVGKIFIALQLMQEITMQVLLGTVFSLHDSSRISQIKSKLTDFIEFTASPLRASLLSFRWLQKDWGPWSPWGQYMHQLRQLDELIYAEIVDRRAQLDPNRTDILTLMLLARDEKGEGMTDPEIRDELMALLIVGHDDSAIALAWAVYWVHHEPEVYQKLMQELASLEADADPMTIFQLPYLTAVCQETLRIYPVAMETSPRSPKQSVELQGYHLEAGTIIFPSIYLTHQREDLYPEPKKFKPERFLERKFSPYEYLPFGGGQRSCIGIALVQLEMKLVLATLLSNFNLALANNRPVKPKLQGLLLEPACGVKMAMMGKRMPSEKKYSFIETV